LLPSPLQKQIKMEDLETILADVLYEGYVSKQIKSYERVNHHDNLKIPSDFKFNLIKSLSHEMIERLVRANPHTFGEVRQIPGLTPAAISSVLVYLTSKISVQSS
ncbi:MAG: hypothetical protein ACR2LT_09145, partial [Pyrinomonadaceae bacterium]